MPARQSPNVPGTGQALGQSREKRARRSDQRPVLELDGRQVEFLGLLYRGEGDSEILNREPG
jgi:hypothetical protein